MSTFPLATTRALLFIGIHNAWDAVTPMVASRPADVSETE